MEVKLEMKITNYASIFLIICILFITITNNSIKANSVMQKEYQSYNRNIDLATDEGLQNLVEVAEVDNLSLNLEECSDHFFNSLFASFGAMDSPSLQARLRISVPALVVTGQDGCYIMYQSLEKGKFNSQWTNKIPYVYDGGAFTVNFEMSDDVTIILDGCDTVFKGNMFHLLKDYPADDEVNPDNGLLHTMLTGSKLLNREYFDAQRRSTIIKTILKEMSFYVNRHNQLAEEFGLTYEFRLPDSSADSVTRTVDDISLLVMFQNYPYGAGTKDVYTRFSVSGSRIAKQTNYYISVGSDKLSYYHKENCYLKGDSKITYKSQKECALTGAYPCPYCNP